MTENNPFEIAQRQLDEAAAILGLDPATHALLREPLRQFIVSIPVRMDDGTVKVFRGYRVQYNDSRGPCKGGLRARTVWVSARAHSCVAPILIYLIINSSYY